MGTKPLRADASMKERLSHFMHELCVEWGFCSIPDDVWQRIVNSRRLSADQFVRDVLAAEGFSADFGGEWSRRLQERFVNQFGVEARAGDYEP
jgi:hypothetical protein